MAISGDGRMAPRALLALTVLALALAAAPPGNAGGPTWVEGTAAGLWTPEGSPYILIGNATVPADMTLEIEAGVVVLADRGVGLAVMGGLLVHGTADAPVRFAANGTGDPGFWRGIHAANPRELVLRHAVVTHAEAALTVMGGSATVVGSSLSGNVYGMHVEGGGASIDESAISGNAQVGIFASGAVVTVRGGLLSGNGVGMDLGGAQARVEHSTFLGSAFADLSLDFDSLATLRCVVREAPLKFLDAMSRVDVEGTLAVSVTDAYGFGLDGAAVLVEDNANGSAVLSKQTDHEGRATGFVVREQEVGGSGTVDYNPFAITARAGGKERVEVVAVRCAADVTLVLPVDLTPPTPIAPRLFATDEDRPVLFDASASTDNDPNLAERGVFLWAFPEVALELQGIQATHAFATPGLYQGVLTVVDASGNDAALTFAVDVADVTPPEFVDVRVPERGALGQTLVFEAAARDNDPGSTPSLLWRFTLGATTIERSGPIVEIALRQAGAWTVTVTARDATGNEVPEARTVTILGPPPPNPWPWIGGGAALLAAALGLSTERGKVGFLTLLIPLYTRLKDGEVLDQFTRGQIFGYIRVHPGDTYTDIKRNLDLNNGTLTYHLDVLEKQGLVRPVVRGARKMFYPVDIRPPEDGGGLHEVQRRLLKGLNEAPGIAVSALAASLGLSRQLALYHLRILAGRGIVRLERRGVKLCGVPVGSPVRDVGGRLKESP